jgi:hypothetical protein
MGGQAQRSYRGRREYDDVRNLLLEASRSRGTVSSFEVARVLNLSPTGNQTGREEGLVLGDISEDEVKARRPMLSALFVKQNGTPGFGFFEWAWELGKFRLGDDEHDFLERTKEEIYQYWADK